MVEHLSNRRSAENEALVQESNQHIANAAKTIFSESEIIHFYCECSREDCQQRIDLPIKQYKELHSQHERYIIVPGHEDLSIEKIVSKENNYYLVSKEQYKNGK